MDDQASSGIRTLYTYEGSQAECETQRILEKIKGATYLNLRPKGDGNYQLVATYPFDAEQGPASEPPTDVHELDVSVAQPNADQCPRLRAIAASAFGSFDAGTAAVGVIKGISDDYLRGDHKYMMGNLRSPTKAEAAVTAKYPDNAVALKIFKTFAYLGTDNFIEYQLVYRRTITAATPLQVQASFVGINKIWTTAELRAYEVLPDDWWFKLPTEYLWHKSHPTVNTVGGHKTQIAYYYTAGLSWAGMLYEAHDSASLIYAP